MGEISNNWPNSLLGTNVYKTLESCCQSLVTMLQRHNNATVLQCNNTTSVIPKWGTF